MGPPAIENEETTGLSELVLLVGKFLRCRRLRFWCISVGAADPDMLKEHSSENNRETSRHHSELFSLCQVCEDVSRGDVVRTIHDGYQFESIRIYRLERYTLFQNPLRWFRCNFFSVEDLSLGGALKCYGNYFSLPWCTFLVAGLVGKDFRHSNKKNIVFSRPPAWFYFQLQFFGGVLSLATASDSLYRICTVFSQCSLGSPQKPWFPFWSWLQCWQELLRSSDYWRWLSFVRALLLLPLASH